MCVSVVGVGCLWSVHQLPTHKLFYSVYFPDYSLQKYFRMLTKILVVMMNVIYT